MVVKYVVDISLTDIDIEHIEYSTRTHQENVALSENVY